MKSDALRWPIGDSLYQLIRSSGKKIIHRVNLVNLTIVMIGASRRGEEVYGDIKNLKESHALLRQKYLNAFDNSQDDLPARATFEELLYDVVEDTLFIAVQERLISGSMMERIAGEKFEKIGKTKEDTED